MRTESVRRLAAASALAVLLGAAAACHTAGPAAAGPPTGLTTIPAYTKVVVIAEENETYDDVIGAKQAPYLTKLAARYGNATAMTANYPVGCPSLAAYILITAGTTAGICDDDVPSKHMLSVDNIFAQVDAAGLSWRTYGQQMPAPCALTNSKDAVFLVRHTPVAYFTGERSRCGADDIPMGSLHAGALHADIAAGRLPAYSFVTPDACHDMHGAPSCPTNMVADGDIWLSQWIPQLLAGPDYRAGRLVIMVTWDEGSDTSNHIPTLMISPTTTGIASAIPYDDCSTLRTAEDILKLAPIGCAATATSMVSAFRL